MAAGNIISSRANPSENCGSTCGIVTGVSDSIYVSPVSVIPPMSHTYVNIVLSVVQKGEIWGPSNKAVLFRVSENNEQKSTFAMFIQENLMLVHTFSMHIMLYTPALMSHLNFYTGSRNDSPYSVNIIHIYQQEYKSNFKLFRRFSQNSKKRRLASPCPSVRMEDQYIFFYHISLSSSLNEKCFR
jgi:hypothetical protein